MHEVTLFFEELGGAARGVVARPAEVRAPGSWVIVDVTPETATEAALLLATSPRRWPPASGSSGRRRRAADGRQLTASLFVADEHPAVAVDGPALLLR